MMTVLKRLVKEERGQGMAEYGLILALVAVAVIAGLIVLGPAIRDKLTSVSDSVTKAQSPDAE